MTPKRLLLGSLLLGLVLSTAVQAASVTTAHAHAAHAQQLQLDHGQKWQTDAALRQGMAAIHLQLADALPAIHAGDISPAALQQLAAGIEAQVAGIVSNCRLEANADAQLHIVIAQLLQGSEQLAGKQPDTPPHAGAMAILQALDGYSGHFDDPELASALQH